MTSELRKSVFLQLMRGASCRFLMVACTVSVLSGCAMSGFDLEKAMPDKNSITGSVAKQPAVTAEVNDSSKVSDQNTIRNVVSALNFTQWGKTPIPWANPDTGSQGTITTVAEKRRMPDCAANLKPRAKPLTALRFIADKLAWRRAVPGL